MYFTYTLLTDNRHTLQNTPVWLMCYLFSLVSFQHLHQGPMCKTGWPPFSCTPMYYQSPHWLIPPPIPSSSPIPSLVSSPQSVLSEYPNSETLPHPPRLKQDPSICNPGHATALEALQLRCPPFTTAPSSAMNGPNPPVQTLLPPVPQLLTFHDPSLS